MGSPAGTISVASVLSVVSLFSLVVRSVISPASLAAQSLPPAVLSVPGSVRSAGLHGAGAALVGDAKAITAQLNAALDREPWQYPAETTWWTGLQSKMAENATTVTTATPPDWAYEPTEDAIDTAIGSGKDLDDVSGSAHDAAAASAAGTTAGIRSISVRTVSDGRAPAPIQ